MTATAQGGTLLGLLPLLILVAAASVTATLNILLRPLLIRYALARPNARSSHREPTPQGGGIAVITATLGISGLVFLAVPSTSSGMLPTLIPIFTATMVLAIVGAVDDIHALPVTLRVLLHTIAVATIVNTLPADLRIVPYLPWGVERALLVLAGVWFVNLVNFMDGIDLMTVAEMIPLTGGLILMGFLGALPVHAVIVALALLGALLGFAPFNRPVARLFLGDVGSLPIGLLTGWLLLLLAGNGQLAAALILPLYYLADATITLGRRTLRGEQIWIAHRTHFYQSATDRGLSVTEIVTRVFAVNCVLVALAAAAALIASTPGKIIALALACLTVGWLLLVFTRGKRRA